MENNFNKRGCLVVAAIFLSIFGLVYYMQSGEDCIRIIPDGAVRCECDFKSSSEWSDYKRRTKGAWEAVVVDGKACK